MSRETFKTLPALPGHSSALHPSRSDNPPLETVLTQAYGVHPSVAAFVTSAPDEFQNELAIYAMRHPTGRGISEFYQTLLQGHAEGLQGSRGLRKPSQPLQKIPFVPRAVTPLDGELEWWRLAASPFPWGLYQLFEHENQPGQVDPRRVAQLITNSGSIAGPAWRDHSTLSEFLYPLILNVQAVLENALDVGIDDQKFVLTGAAAFMGRILAEFEFQTGADVDWFMTYDWYEHSKCPIQIIVDSSEKDFKQQADDLDVADFYDSAKEALEDRGEDKDDYTEEEWDEAVEAEAKSQRDYEADNLIDSDRIYEEAQMIIAGSDDPVAVAARFWKCVYSAYERLVSSSPESRPHFCSPDSTGQTPSMARTRL